MTPSRGEPAGDTREYKERPPDDITEAVRHACVFLFHAVAAVAIVAPPVRPPKSRDGEREWPGEVQHEIALL